MTHTPDARTHSGELNEKMFVMHAVGLGPEDKKKFGPDFAETEIQSLPTLLASIPLSKNVGRPVAVDMVKLNIEGRETIPILTSIIKAQDLMKPRIVCVYYEALQTGDDGLNAMAQSMQDMAKAGYVRVTGEGGHQQTFLLEGTVVRPPRNNGY
jgi:hypothetical protein